MKAHIQHFFSTILHKFWVLFHLIQFSTRLIWRGLIHDLSKFSPTEVKGFVTVIQELKTLEYNSPEYKESLRKLGPALTHHYEKNSHHPEHYILGIDGMNLADVVEMWCDWQASIRRYKDSTMKKSLPINKKRFELSDQLNNIFENELTEDK